MELKIFILFAMVFMHIVDDYYLQGILAKMKQEKWWRENVPSYEFYKYKHDYIVALLMHAFSWSFMINLPALLICDRYLIMCLFIFLNTLIHAAVDNAKANWHAINLITDQICHLVQIIGLWVVVIYG